MSRARIMYCVACSFGRQRPTKLNAQQCAGCAVCQARTLNSSYPAVKPVDSQPSMAAAASSACAQAMTAAAGLSSRRQQHHPSLRAAVLRCHAAAPAPWRAQGAAAVSSSQPLSAPAAHREHLASQRQHVGVVYGRRIARRALACGRMQRLHCRARTCTLACLGALLTPRCACWSPACCQCVHAAGSSSINQDSQ